MWITSKIKSVIQLVVALILGVAVFIMIIFCGDPQEEAEELDY